MRRVGSEARLLAPTPSPLAWAHLTAACQVSKIVQHAFQPAASLALVDGVGLPVELAGHRLQDEAEPLVDLAIRKKATMLGLAPKLERGGAHG